MPNLLYDALFRPHENSRKTFLILRDGSEISYAAFLGMAARFAHALAEAGVGVGDRVALQAKKSPEALAVYAACVANGRRLPAAQHRLHAGRGRIFRHRFRRQAADLRWRQPRGLEPVAAKAGARLLTLDGDGSGHWPTRRMASRTASSRAARGAGRPRRVPLHLGHDRALQGRHADPRQSASNAERWSRPGASQPTTCCCTRCRSSTRTACSSPPT